MGFVTCLGACATCKRPFSFNPVKVPSIRIDGVREPVCKSCIDSANPIRVARGLPPIEVLDGAYEAADEYELDCG